MIYLWLQSSGSTSLLSISSHKEFKPIDEEESKHIIKKCCMLSDLPEEMQIVAQVPPGEVKELPVIHPKWIQTATSGMTSM